jgi:hypothetical protein
MSKSEYASSANLHAMRSCLCDGSLPRIDFNLFRLVALGNRGLKSPFHWHCARRLEYVLDQDRNRTGCSLNIARRALQTRRLGDEKIEAAPARPLFSVLLI